MARTRRRFRRILHASDSSAASRRAFDTALDLARATGASLLLVHVLPHRPDVSLALRTYDEIVRALRARGTEELDRLVARAEAAGVSAEAIVVDTGAPAAQIVRVAASRDADVIVMGTRGRTGLARAVLGSVASRVVATAPCPVLTVRGR
jgi:nucleotide-binding universal stress UspA family protein